MKILIVGCGSIGARHARNLNRLGAGPLAFHDAVADRSRSLAVELGGAAVADLDEGLAARPDAVLVCAPTAAHVDLASRAVSAGAHCFVEKPISGTPGGVDTLVAEATRRERLLLVGCKLRFHRPVATLRRWLDSGAIGRPLVGRFQFGNYLPNWRPLADYRHTYSADAAQGGGILLEAIHEIDAARWFLGEPVLVAAMAAKVGPLEMEAEDVAGVLLRFASGAMAGIHLDCLRPQRGRSCELIGDAGMALWRAEGKEPERSVLELRGRDGACRERLEFDSDLNEMYLDEMRHFLRCVDGSESPALDGEGAKRDLEIALAAREAASSGRAVSVTVA